MTRAVGYFALSLLTGCIVDDSRCGPNQVATAGALQSCQCAPGSVLAADRYHCVPCGVNEAPSPAGTCTCREGYERSAASGACEEVVGSYFGKPCSEAAPCGEPAPYCAISESAPYCTTSGCAHNADCPEFWCRRRSGDISFCATPPTGLGDPCSAPADCAGKEASFCEAFSTYLCLVDDCLGRPGTCPSGLVCCDFTLLSGASLCVVEDALADGLCPGGMAPVAQ